MLTNGQKLKQIRALRGISQPGLGAILGVVQSAVTSRELGKTELSHSDIVKVSKGLKIDPMFFFTEMDIASADLLGEAPGIVTEIKEKLVTLDEERLRKVSKLIDTI